MDTLPHRIRVRPGMHHMQRIELHIFERAVHGRTGTRAVGESEPSQTKVPDPRIRGDDGFRGEDE